MAAKNDELFTRAANAADKVVQLIAEHKRVRENLKKAKVEARSLYKQVLEALGKRPRQRKSKAATPTQYHDLPAVSCWVDGCGKPSVAAVSDFEGRTWECCPDHTTLIQDTHRDTRAVVPKENTDG